MQPVSLNNPNLYRGPATSKEFNDLRNDMHTDLVTLFNIANDHGDLITSHMDVLLRENFFLQSRIKDLQDRLDEIEQAYVYQQEGVSRQRLIHPFYDLDNLFDAEATKQAYINTVYGYCSLPPNDSVNKIAYKTDDGSIVIPSSFKATLFESNDTASVDPETGGPQYSVITDNNLSLAFDNNKNSFWIHTSSFAEESGVSEVYGILDIQLPLDTLNNVNVNTLSLNPYPDYALTITDIQYKGIGNQWYRLPNYPTEKDGSGNDVPVAISNATKQIFAFPETQITELKISFTQPYWFSNNGYRDFSYGFQDIFIEDRVYQSSEASIVTHFSLAETTKGFVSIDAPKINLVQGTSSNLDGLVSFELYYDKALTNQFNFGSEIMAPVQDIYVKMKILSEGDIIPFIQSISIDFDYKDVNDF